jgi:hypothetical protein
VPMWRVEFMVLDVLAEIAQPVAEAPHGVWWEEPVGANPDE